MLWGRRAVTLRRQDRGLGWGFASQRGAGEEVSLHQLAWGVFAYSQVSSQTMRLDCRLQPMSYTIDFGFIRRRNQIS
jgi:hypothetical protein